MRMIVGLIKSKRMVLAAASKDLRVLSFLDVDTVA
jgi:hypothetical protein